MTGLLALITVVSWGTWIPVSQAVRGVAQRVRTLYVTVGNVVFATIAVVVGGGHISVGWRHFWLPLAGGLLWTLGSYSAFRATETIGLARAAGTWTSLNIVMAFAWGALLFHELNSFSAGRFVVVAIGLVLVSIGVLLIVGSQDARRSAVVETAVVSTSAVTGSKAAFTIPAGVRPYRGGLLWAAAAGVLWGSYFVPAQWAKVPAQVSNFPLALGILAGGLALALPGGEALRLGVKVASVELSAGLLFGIGNLTLLGLVSRLGTGVGFTIAQLSLMVNAGVGIWIFKVPKPGSHPARIVLAGIVFAAIGGVLVGAVN